MKVFLILLFFCSLAFSQQTGSISKLRVTDTLKVEDGLILPAGSIDSTDLADNAVTSKKILDGTLSTDDYGPASITGGKMANYTITGPRIALYTIQGYNIDTSAITSIQLGENAATTAKIDDGAVTTDKMDERISIDTLDVGAGGLLNTGSYYSTGDSKGYWFDSRGGSYYGLGMSESVNMIMKANNFTRMTFYEADSVRVNSTLWFDSMGDSQIEWNDLTDAAKDSSLIVKNNGTFTCDFGSFAAHTTRDTVIVSSQANFDASTDVVILNLYKASPPVPTVGLMWTVWTDGTDDGFSLRLANITNGAIDPAEMTWNWTIIKGD